MAETIFSHKGDKGAWSIPGEDAAFAAFTPDAALTRKELPALPVVSELDLMRHFSRLARRNMGVDTHFYPLGSCTMKYNPRINEAVAAFDGFTNAHPLAPPELVEGSRLLMNRLLHRLQQITGMSAGSLAPNAGAQGELAGVRMIAAYHRKRGESHRNEILVPDSAHGTNPATAGMAGLKTLSVRSLVDGSMDLDHLDRLLSERTAGLMLTNPTTLGLFSKEILQVTRKVHEAGGLLYYDGANLNAIMNIARPAAMGFDVVHLNLHKTFSTPHGGGGPGSGPVLCNERLRPFLPNSALPDSIGRLSTFMGNFLVCVRAYCYILLHGDYGLRHVAEHAVLNANYLRKRLGKSFHLPYDRFCMHEFVIQPKKGRALDVAKRLLDYGVHAPTIYFPLIVEECMLVEPTETESKETLDRFAEIMEKIANEEEELLANAPYTMPVSRLDEVRAAKNMELVASPC